MTGDIVTGLVPVWASVCVTLVCKHSKATLFAPLASHVALLSKKE